jgi:hypothetical protein
MDQTYPTPVRGHDDRNGEFKRYEIKDRSPQAIALWPNPA